MAKTIDPANYSGFVVTGNYYNSNKKFSNKYSDVRYAFSINLWRGRVWGIRKDNGKRELLKRVFN